MQLDDQTLVVWFLGIVVVVVPTLVGLMALRYGRGIATWIFAINWVLIALAAGLGLYVGITRTVLSLFQGLIVGLIFCVPALLWLVRKIITPLTSTSLQLAANAAEVAAAAKQSSATAAEHASAIAEMSATVAELEQTSNATANSARDVVAVASTALARGREGKVAIESVTTVLELIAQIGEIVDLVGDLADQSNLLAVNAGIEGAKAGEHGRGFSVVASEVRNLAEQSKRATHRIRSAVGRADEGRQAISRANGLLDAVVQVLEDSSSRAVEIGSMATQQAGGVSEISQAMVGLRQAGDNSADAARQLESSAEQLLDLAAQISKLVKGR
jgi:methyl-accepting chemotaxis protein